MKLLVNDVDISQFYTNLQWAGNDQSAARTVNFGVVVSGTDKNLPKLSILQKDEIKIFNDDGELVFLGQVLDKEKSISGNVMNVSGADNLIIANNSEGSFSFEEKTPDAIAKEAFESIGLEVGNLESGSPITRKFDVMNIYNIVYTAYKIENELTDIPYIIRMNDGKVEVVKKGNYIAKWRLDPKANLIDATYSESSKDVVSNVKIFDENGNEVGEVTGEVKGGGTQIYRQEKDEDANARAKELLKGLDRTASIRAFGNFEYITGNAIMVEEPFTGLIGKFFITSDTHTFENNQHFVDLELSYENIMNDIDTSVPEEGLSDTVTELSGPTASKALQAGASVQGARYDYGGNNPSTGIDCSGFVQWSYKQAGANIPGRLTSAEIRRDPSQYGFVEVPYSQRQPGDVLWQKGHVAMQYDSSRIIESGGVSKNVMGYSGVAISKASGRTFSKAYRYVG